MRERRERGRERERERDRHLDGDGDRQTVRHGHGVAALTDRGREAERQRDGERLAHSQAIVLKMAPRNRNRIIPNPYLPAAKRLQDRTWRILQIRTKWCDEFQLHYPLSYLPEPPLCWSPWERRAWDSDYRVWRDCIELMLIAARERHD